MRIDARPETVFAYFTDPARMVRWMGTDATLDPRPGGICRVGMTRDVAETAVRGEFAGSGRDRINVADGERDSVRCGSGRDRVRADAFDRLGRCERVRRVR